MTLRLPVQPFDSHGTVLVSGIAFDWSGPDFRNRRRTSLRNESFFSSHVPPTGPGYVQFRRFSCANGHAAIAASWSGRSAVGRT